MSVLEPRLNPETVAALLDTGWRVADAEAARTDSLDRKLATLASFASILVSIAAISAASVELGGMVVAGLICATALLTGSVIVAVVALLPQEQRGFAPTFVEELPTWRQARKAPAAFRGEVLHAVVDVVSRERDVNDRKAWLVRIALLLLLSGVVLIAVEGLTLLLWTTIR